MSDKSRWQEEYDMLPQWAKSFVDGMKGWQSHGVCCCQVAVPGHDKDNAVTFVKTTENIALFDGIYGALQLAHALDAPWPKTNPSVGSSNTEPCVFGDPYPDHSDGIGCSCDEWKWRPRQCTRSRADPEWRHEDD